MDCSCCFSLGENLDFLDFFQKKFYNIDYMTKFPKNYIFYFHNNLTNAAW